jgi:hypothetical protein
VASTFCQHKTDAATAAPAKYFGVSTVISMVYWFPPGESIEDLA